MDAALPASPPIEDHAVIGDLRTAALVGLDGSIPFLCAPDFASPSVFAALLDPAAGHFRIHPGDDGVRVSQRYLPDTNVVVTRFMSADGIAELTDLMTLAPDPGAEPPPPQCLVRQVRVLRGRFTFVVECRPRFDYARAGHRLEALGNGGVFRPDGAGPVLALRASAKLQADGADLVGKVGLSAGRSACFVLEIGPADPCGDLDEAAVDAAVRDTIAWWQHWISGSRYQGRWREVVGRSALALKLMTSARHGAMVAAATFGLPERSGGAKNWDYRYCWIRDTSFAMYAFVRLGLVAEMEGFVDWIADRVRDCAGSGADSPLRIMYALDGGSDLAESELPHLRGWQGSQPVRTGNGAADQFQLDIYGELMDALYLANKYGRSSSYADWQDVCRIVAWVQDNWRRPDRGIWESRGEDRPYLYSRLMCWVALDRAVRLAQKRSLPAPMPEWNQTRLEIHASIHAEYWDAERDSFVQYPGAATVDGAMLLMPLLRFISPRDPRWMGTMRLVRQQLAVDALVFRRPPDGSGGGAEGAGAAEQEGAFLACSFWYAEALARGGEVAEARLLFDKLLGYANHVGLYAEELSFSGAQLGNFPQVLTHLALISAASYLDKALSGKGRETWA